MSPSKGSQNKRSELTMPEVDEEFQHEVEVWTVGDLKKALADIADAAKLIFSTAEEPGSDMAGPEQVAFSAGTNECYDSHTHGSDPVFEVSLEFPPRDVLSARVEGRRALTKSLVSDHRRVRTVAA